MLVFFYFIGGLAAIAATLYGTLLAAFYGAEQVEVYARTLRLKAACALNYTTLGKVRLLANQKQKGGGNEQKGQNGNNGNQAKKANDGSKGVEERFNTLFKRVKGLEALLADLDAKTLETLAQRITALDADIGDTTDDVETLTNRVDELEAALVEIRGY